MISQKTVEISVGVFMVLGIVALLMLALRVSGLNDVYTKDKGYEVKAYFTNIGGLKEKAKVSVGGVTVGRVNKIDLDSNEYVAVVTLMIKDSFRSLPDDTQASILTAGLLGDNYIGLVPGFSEEFLQAGSEIPLENTNSAVVLEQLISKFVSEKASSQ